jgi:hypothetical protein
VLDVMKLKAKEDAVNTWAGMKQLFDNKRKKSKRAKII